MDQYLIKSVHVISPESSWNNQLVDIYIEGGSIAKIGKDLSKLVKDSIQIVDGKGHVVSPGFFDLNANFGEPGFETKETVKSGAEAAFAGGFTGVAVQPNTDPPLHRHAEVALLKQRAKNLPVDIYPIGTVSKGREGKELAEMFDMAQAGAIAFSDGDRSISDAGLMGRAILYAKGIDALVMSFPDDRTVSAGTKMNEGEVSTYLGMKGNPNLAEALMVARDLYLAEYYETRIHFSTISTAESLDLIRKAKAKKLAVTCDVAAHHLVLTDEEVKGFDSNFKVHPPLRTQKDIKALLKGIKDNVIDAVVSQHTPQEVEYKRVEFHVAKDGIIGLQTVLPLLVQAGLDAEQIVDKLSIGPRRVLNLPVPVIEEGAAANLVVFNLDQSWTFDESNNLSFSANSPYLGTTLKGFVRLTINNGQAYIAS